MSLPILSKIRRLFKPNKTLNIIEFVESPYGLNSTNEIKLFPVQKFILKVLYNIELDTKTKSIRIPKSWQFADLPEHYHNFTEAEYMQYLYNES